MSNINKKICFPRFDPYTNIIFESLKKMGFNVILPPPITKRTYQIGSSYLDELTCFPMRVTLGNFIEAIKAGATDLIMGSTDGVCRFKTYGYIHQQVIKRLGYKVRFHIVSFKRPIKLYKTCKLLNPNFSILKFLKIFYDTFRKIYNFEKQKEEFNQKFSLKVLIIGEFYTCLERTVNLNIETKLNKLGIGVINSLSMTHLLKWAIGLRREKEKAWTKKVIKSLYPFKLWGHANDSIKNLLYYKDKVDGVIFIYPFACMPEVSVKKTIEYLSSDFNLPLLSLVIDDNISEVNLDNRLEAFCEMLKAKRKC